MLKLPMPPKHDDDDGWQATRQQVGGATRIVADQEDYLGEPTHAVGRHLGNGQWEMFVTCDPADALGQQFDHFAPEFIAVHDVGTASSRRLLAGLAGAAGTPLHKLVIRRQGHGVALATLEFVELPGLAGGPALRLYTTETDAPTQIRHQLARRLLAHSRLGVVLVGELPPHALTSALRPLQDAIIAGPWHNRHLLMLPLGASGGSGTLGSQASQLALGMGVNVRTTPPVTKPAEAWGFISGAWNRLRDQLGAAGVALPALPAGAAVAATVAPPAAPAAAAALANAASAPASASTAFPAAAATGNARGMQPMPPVPGPQRGAAAPAVPAVLETYVRRCAELKGMLSCCVFDLHSQRTVAHAGVRPGPAVLASQGTALMAAMADAGRALGLGSAAPDAAITLGQHHLLLRAVPNHPGRVLHAVIDAGTGNLTLLRLQMQRLDAVLGPPAAA